MVALAYGPPPQRGVTTLMSVGADDALLTAKPQDLLFTAGAVLYVFGVVTGGRTMERAGFWGGLAGLAWKIIGR